MEISRLDGGTGRHSTAMDVLREQLAMPLHLSALRQRAVETADPLSERALWKYHLATLGQHGNDCPLGAVERRDCEYKFGCKAVPNTYVWFVCPGYPETRSNMTRPEAERRGTYGDQLGEGNARLR